MPYYSDELIEEVRSRNDIVDVIGSYVRLKKKGSTYFGLCPFHNEKTGSFSVSPNKQMYYCFGCGAGGNVFTFLMQYENFTFGEAMQSLADRVGIELPQQEMTSAQRREADRRTRLLEINKEAAKYFYTLLRSPRGQKAYQYFKKRELSDETMQKFGLGYSDQYSDDLYRYLRKKGYDDDILKDSGLITIDEVRGGHDKFWNRAMFPIMDVHNRVIGFGGRVMGDGEPKYLNSPETRIFDKSRNLYGLNIARTTRKNQLLLCEGYMDVIALHQAGFDNAVASLGTALTSGHANLLKRYTKEVYLTYDSDGAGVKAALRAIPILKEVGIVTKVINMRPYKDPDEFIKALGAEEYQKRIDEAENSFLFEIRIMQENYDMNDPESKTAFEREVAAKLVTFKEKLERDNYLKAVCRQFMIPEDGMRQMVSRLGNQEGIISRNAGAGTMQPTVERKPKKKREDGLRQAEKMLLTWLISDRDIFDKVAAYIKPEDFIDPLFSGVAEKVYEQYGTGNISPAAIIADYATTEEHTEVAAMFSADLDESLNNLEREKTLNDIVIRIKANSLNHELNKTVDPKRMQEIIIEQQKLNQIHIKL